MAKFQSRLGPYPPYPDGSAPRGTLKQPGFGDLLSYVGPEAKAHGPR